MKLLLHCCCGPCAMYPLSELVLDENIETEMFWYNPNIHPEFEWNRRLDNLKIVSKFYNLNLNIADGYMEDFWRSGSYNDEYNSRCEMCYDVRLDNVAKEARDKGFDAFSTTLLVSPYQNHEIISETALKKEKKYGVKFYYRDFRPGFRLGQNMARDIGLYRQKYCGCCFSLDESDFKEKIIRSFES